MSDKREDLLMTLMTTGKNLSMTCDDDTDDPCDDTDDPCDDTDL